MSKKSTITIITVVLVVLWAALGVLNYSQVKNMKLPSLSCAEATGVFTLLRMHKGAVPVILFDASQNKYVKAAGYEVEKSEGLDASLKAILGQKAVLWQEFS
jgi:hypothetical protein